jgi:carbamoyl-phosphate synthase large subunit
VLVDKYIVGRELETDAVCDGTNVYIPGIMSTWNAPHPQRRQHQRLPTFSVSDQAKKTITDYTVRLGWHRHHRALQHPFIVAPDDKVYASRSTPVPAVRFHS